jgi:hypothetical protein
MMEVLVQMKPQSKDAHPDDAAWQLPSTLVCTSGIVPRVRARFGLPPSAAVTAAAAGEAKDEAALNAEEEVELVENVLAHGDLLWGFDRPLPGDPLPGFVRDERDTDNAWVETNLYVVVFFFLPFLCTRSLALFHSLSPFVYSVHT